MHKKKIEYLFFEMKITKTLPKEMVDQKKKKLL